MPPHSHTHLQFTRVVEIAIKENEEKAIEYINNNITL